MGQNGRTLLIGTVAEEEKSKHKEFVECTNNKKIQKIQKYFRLFGEELKTNNINLICKTKSRYNKRGDNRVWKNILRMRYFLGIVVNEQM